MRTSSLQKSNSFWRGATLSASSLAWVAFELTRFYVGDLTLHGSGIRSSKVQHILPGKKLRQFAGVSATDHCKDTTCRNILIFRDLASLSEYRRGGHELIL